MTNFENLTTEQRIRASLYRDLQSLSKETLHFLGLDITKPAMEMLFEIFMHRIVCYAEDLEAFARHGKRFIINGDDVRILARRNKSMRKRLDAVVPPNPPNPASSSKDTSKRRKTVPANLNTPAKRAKPQETTKAKADLNKSVDLTDD